ncbi:hypothetical protein ACF1DV_25930 [Streptomyces achromogenes]|uniref:hypothetical protein n=1 Tax=Streptomyces achromogenes TaxID=67255 RepID=UPI0036FC8BFF
MAEQTRDERRVHYFDNFHKADLAERVVELEDELGAAVSVEGDRLVALEARDAEIHRLTELLRYEHNRANSAIDREDAAEACAEELRDERDRYRLAWTSARSRVKRARWAGISDLRFTRNMWADAVRDLARYRLAWLSARRRAADEANMAAEAVDHIRRDRDRWRSGHETAEAQLVHERRDNARLRAELERQRQTTDAPRLEFVGADEDGEVWRLAQ